jgi:DNA polymerase I-like protein with 3'-5' exonuclease and polymerase domains
MNTPIQGSSADMTKLALALWYEIITHPDNAGTDCTGARIVAVVHDEIVVEAPEWATKQVATLLSNVMTRAAKTYLKRVTVPPVDVAVESYWSKE